MLEFDFVFLSQGQLLPEFYQSPEFGFQVLHVETPVLVSYFRVVPGDGYIRESDFALMAPSEPYGELLVGTQEMQVSLFLVFPHVFFGIALEDEVGLVRTVQTYHLYLLRVGKPNSLGEEFLAYFALQLGEVVSGSDSHYFLPDLAEHPLLETVHVYERTTAFALTGIHQGILRGVFLAKADLTAALHVLLDLVHVAVELEMGGLFQRAPARLIPNFDDQVLNPAEPQDIPRLYKINAKST